MSTPPSDTIPDIPPNIGTSGTINTDEHEELLIPEPDVIIDQRYQLIKQIGEGGMGAVYLALQLAMNRKVVVKILKTSLCGSPEQVKRFHREARLVSQLSHPNSIITHDFGHYRGIYYIVMEYLEGITLADQLYKVKQLSVLDTVKIIKQVSQSLAEAHQLGVIHRDLKPENIFLISQKEQGYRVKVLDFGIAILAHDHPEASAARVTTNNIVFGTPQYMAPEQIRGEELDTRSDVYALGIIFYQCVHGILPFDGDKVMDILTQHLTQPVPLRSISRVVLPSLDTEPRVQRLLSKLLTKDRERRTSSVTELLSQLNELELELSTINATPKQTSSFKWYLIFLLLLGVLGSSLYYKDMMIQSSQSPQTFETEYVELDIDFEQTALQDKLEALSAELQEVKAARVTAENRLKQLTVEAGRKDIQDVASASTKEKSQAHVKDSDPVKESKAHPENSKTQQEKLRSNLLKYVVVQVFKSPTVTLSGDILKQVTKDQYSLVLMMPNKPHKLVCNLNGKTKVFPINKTAGSVIRVRCDMEQSN